MRHAVVSSGKQNSCVRRAACTGKAASRQSASPASTSAAAPHRRLRIFAACPLRFARIRRPPIPKSVCKGGGQQNPPTVRAERFKMPSACAPGIFSGKFILYCAFSREGSQRKASSIKNRAAAQFFAQQLRFYVWGVLSVSYPRRKKLPMRSSRLFFLGAATVTTGFAAGYGASGALGAGCAERGLLFSICSSAS